MKYKIEFHTVLEIEAPDEDYVRNIAAYLMDESKERRWPLRVTCHDVDWEFVEEAHRCRL